MVNERASGCGVYLGSFDPLHDNHVAKLSSCLRFLDRILVVVGSNPSKAGRSPLFTVEERIDIIKTLFPTERVIVEALEEDFVGQVRRHEAVLFIQGIREPKEAEAGWSFLKDMSEKAPEMMTIFVHDSSDADPWSSTRVRELIVEGRFDELRCPPLVCERLRQKRAAIA